MSRERYVLLGFAHVRTEWFRSIGHWATSAMLAVLIMALIGAAMWLVFSDVFDDASDSIREEVGRIGDS